MSSDDKRRIRRQVQAWSLLALGAAIVALLGPWPGLFVAVALVAGATATWRYFVMYRNAIVASVEP